MTEPIRAILFDLEGTLYFKGALVEGVTAALESVASSGLERRFLTNSDSKTRERIAQELAALGLELPVGEIFTASTAALTFLRQRPNNRCFALLPAALREEFAPFIERTGRVDYVVVGDVRESVSYETLNTAFRHLRAGAKLIALQKGRYFVRADGEYLDTGAFAELLQYASGQTAIVMGKPSPSFFDLALRDVGCAPKHALVVGDDISTDIAGAHAIGARSVLVRTGKFDPNGLGSVQLPTELLSSVADLPGLLASWRR